MLQQWRSDAPKKGMAGEGGQLSGGVPPLVWTILGAHPLEDFGRSDKMQLGIYFHDCPRKEAFYQV